MTNEFMGIITGEVPEEPDADAGLGTAPSARYIDPRDRPRGSPGPGGFNPPSEDPGGPVAPVPVKVADPVPTIPGFGRVITARTIDIDANAGPVLLGLDPSRPQGNLHVAYLLIETDVVINIAGDQSALPMNRYEVQTTGPIRFDHVAGVYAWAGAAAAHVSMLVVGV